MVSSKLLITISFLVFGLMIVLISAVRLAQPTMFAADFSQNMFTSSTSAMPHAGNIDQLPVDFFQDFPVPKMLPDHPLYWSLMIVDKVRIITARSDQKKYEYLVDCADRRLSGAAVLIVNGKDDLGVTTISKAEKYLLKALQYADTKQKKELQLVVHKHAMMLEAFNDIISDEYKASLESSLGINHQVMDRLQ